MLYREIIEVCSEIHRKHINTLCGQNTKLLNFKLVVHIVTAGLWLIYITRNFSSYRSVNTLYRGYINQSVNAV